MIEPTETESKETLDAFVAALREIVETAKPNPQAILEAPVTTVVGRIDEPRSSSAGSTVGAGRDLSRWRVDQQSRL